MSASCWGSSAPDSLESASPPRRPEDVPTSPRLAEIRAEALQAALNEAGERGLVQTKELEELKHLCAQLTASTSQLTAQLCSQQEAQAALKVEHSAEVEALQGRVEQLASLGATLDVALIEASSRAASAVEEAAAAAITRERTLSSAWQRVARLEAELQSTKRAFAQAQHREGALTADLAALRVALLASEKRASRIASLAWPRGGGGSAEGAVAALPSAAAVLGAGVGAASRISISGGFGGGACAAGGSAQSAAGGSAPPTHEELGLALAQVSSLRYELEALKKVVVGGEEGGGGTVSSPSKASGTLSRALSARSPARAPLDAPKRSAGKVQAHWENSLRSSPQHKLSSSSSPPVKSPSSKGSLAPSSASQMVRGGET